MNTANTNVQLERPRSKSGIRRMSVFSRTLMGFEAAAKTDTERQRAIVEEVAERQAMAALKVLANKWRKRSQPPPPPSVDASKQPTFRPPSMQPNPKPFVSGPNLMGYVVAR